MYKIVIWGHKNNGHTHGYIHSSYYKAFKAMGFETYWFDNNENVSGFNFDNSIFFTEDQVQSNIPLNKTCKYILHHTNLDKYIQNNLSFINLGNYSKWCEDGISPYHKENSVIKIAECCFWDEKSKTIYQPWATDLLPDEIDFNNALHYNKDETNVYYIGTIHDNYDCINSFSNSVNKHQKKFINTKTKSDAENMMLIQKTLVSVDIRGEWHKEYGYLPCRVFKNISYGRLTGTNSETVKKILGDHVIYEPNCGELFLKMIEAENSHSIDQIKSSMEFIKLNHTFVNRINNLLICLEL